ncbi:FAS1-like dehydratase domain-containing protein [Mycolicibacterium holsaticum]|uniref:FAS1-like dehydratase domain-containing protein n=1 Tax=Mycolicibacterium holsaticum TaxID=152142 RepID=UPI001C7DF1BE|nr:MaoC family dehydratase N-terminal domain-containing protein [Mycolicibacterium holsaticum]MDA4108512.1 acyl dehydratase [Mycolicibacterium holsaticum DSM 44478 = JCM 12374]QZA12742.1 MaoC family dehydratase N-terminal domain-containing protein [Mycolicibacterium holsaticum DSM 44478 = JCM 12374]UNC09784.1 MaoC family dehydratase N-terminal domain-containing protein [Mycolicibacterium holsaticum DSM 44478 = JCM 12374]
MTTTDESLEAGSFPLITDETLGELRARIGQPFERPYPHVTEATRDSIRHWALGIGDTNPLWLEPDYAADTRWKGIVAPGTMLYAFDRVVSGYVTGMPGVHAMFAGTDWNWAHPLRLGDTVEAFPILKDLRDLESRFSGRAVKQTYEVRFVNQDGLEICRADSWCIRTQREIARRRADRSHVAPYQWNTDELARIAEHYANERPRGKEPLYWDEVQPGDPLPVVLKGPSTVTGFVAFTQGWGSLYVKAHGVAFDMFRAHPALGILNQQGVPEPPERVHWDNDLAQRVGVPAAYDYGPERVSWLGHLMTNWIGDNGFLRRLNVQVRHHNIIGDLTTCEGTVTRKWIDGVRHLVEVDVRGINQNGETTAAGVAVAELPSKSAELDL